MVDLLLGIKIKADGGPQTVREVRAIDDQVKRLEDRNARAAATAKELADAYDLDDAQIAQITQELIRQEEQAEKLKDAFDSLGATEKAIRQLQDSLVPDDNANRLLKSLGDIVDSSENVEDVARRLKDAFELDDADADELAKSLELLGKEGQDTERIARQLADAFDLPENEIDAVTRQLRQLEGAADSADGAAGGLGGRITEIGIAIKSAGVDLLVDSLRSLGRVATDTIGGAINEFRAFEDAGAAAATLVDDVNLLESELRTVGDNLNGAASQTELLASSYDVLSAGFTDASDAATILEASVKAANGGFSDTATVADAVTTILNAYNLEASDAEDITDQLVQTQNLGKITVDQYAQSIGRAASIAASSGVPFEELNAAIAAATAAGVPAESAISGVRQAIINLQKPTNDARDLLRDFGIENAAATLQSEGLLFILQQLADQGATSQQLAQIFSDVDALATIAPIAGENIGRFEASLAGLQDDAGVTNANFAEVTATLTGLQKRFDSLRKDSLLALGEALAPLAATVLEFLESVLSVVQQDLSLDSFAESAERLNQALNENPEIAQAVGAALADIAQVLSDLITNQLVAFTELLEENPEAIQENIAAVGEFVQAIGSVAGLLNDIFTAAGQAKDALEVAFGGSIGLVQNLLQSVTALVEFLENRLGGLGNLLDDFAESAGNIPGVGQFIQGRYTGGPINQGDWYTVAERGSEIARIGSQTALFDRPTLISPAQSGYVYNAGQTARMMAQASGVPTGAPVTMQSDLVAGLRADVQRLTKIVQERPATQSRDTYYLNTPAPQKDAVAISSGKMRAMARRRGLG